MTQLTDLPTASIVAEGAPANPEGGMAFDPFLLIMLAIFALLIFSMFRRSKKAQQQQQELRSTLAPGVEVMTTMGLFGTILAVDKDENKAIIELSPGNTATVHLQAIGKAVEPTAPAAPADNAPFESPDYRGDADGTLQDPGTGSSTDTHPENGPDDQLPGGGRPRA